MKLAASRKKRYGEKLAFANENLDRLEDWLPAAENDEKSYAASAKVFQELVEAIMDIAAMLLKDLGSLPGDDYTNIRKLADKKVISQSDASLIAEANGLRNVVVHRYNHVDRLLFVESAKRLSEHIPGILEKLSIWKK